MKQKIVAIFTVYLLLMLILPSNAATQELNIQIYPSKTQVKVGDSISARWTVESTSGLLTVKHIWKIKEDGGPDFITVQESTEPNMYEDAFTPTYGQQGILVVQARDGKNFKEASFPFDIIGSIPSPIIIDKPNIDKQTVKLNEDINANWTASGGNPPYTYLVTWALYNASDYLTSAVFKVSDTTHSFRPHAGASGAVAVTVIDSIGRKTSSDYSNFIISGWVPTAFLNVKLTLDTHEANASAREVIKANASVEGGTGQYTYNFFWNITEHDNLELQMVRSVRNSKESSDSFIVTYGKSGYVYVTVFDSEGQVYGDGASFAITGGPSYQGHLFAKGVIDPQSGTGGQPMSVSVTQAQGGNPPYSYVFKWFDNTVPYNVRQIHAQAESENLTSTTILPGSLESGFVEVTMRDVIGRLYVLDPIYFYSSPRTIKGDVNDSGTVDLSDLSNLVEFFVSNKPVNAPKNGLPEGQSTLSFDSLSMIIDLLIEK